ncbi:MAG: signal peptidase II [Roseburia sp.]|nr:signal peptidase II [Roseburia sp.]
MLYIGIAAGIFILDFLIKGYVDKKYSRKVRHPKFNNKVFIEKYYNNGAILNFLEEKPTILKVFQTILLLAVCVWLYFSVRRDGGRVSNTGLAFLIGGGASNLFDRYTKGHVVDYIGFSVGPKWFRRIVFNVSDFFIFIGSVLLVIGQKNT